MSPFFDAIRPITITYLAHSLDMREYRRGGKKTEKGNDKEKGMKSSLFTQLYILPTVRFLIVFAMGVISPSVIIHLYLSLPHFSSLSFSLFLSLFFPVRISKKKHLDTWSGLCFCSFFPCDKNKERDRVNGQQEDSRRKGKGGEGKGRGVVGGRT